MLYDGLIGFQIDGGIVSDGERREVLGFQMVVEVGDDALHSGGLMGKTDAEGEDAGEILEGGDFGGRTTECMGVGVDIRGNDDGEFEAVGGDGFDG